ncbi:MAG TPA: hypothetical protein VL084_14860 [Thermoanaerobaculia bacterium]|nr:hypothetical protein [Thermoanaerobaculia bacterium]
MSVPSGSAVKPAIELANPEDRFPSAADGLDGRAVSSCSGSAAAGGAFRAGPESTVVPASDRSEGSLPHVGQKAAPDATGFEQ